MPKPKKGPRLGSDPSHQRQMLSNLALSLFEHERIRTTEAKAKLLRPYAERLITKAKNGTVHDRRGVLSVIEDRGVVHKLFADIAPRFSERNGGYTRILKLGPRSGDGAPMALIELVDAPAELAVETAAEGTTRRRRLGPRRRREGVQDKPAQSKAAQASAAGRDEVEESFPDEEEPKEAARAEAEDAAALDAQPDAAEPKAEAPEEAQ